MKKFPNQYGAARIRAPPKVLGLFLKDLDFCEGINLPLERNESLCCEENFG